MSKRHAKLNAEYKRRYSPDSGFYKIQEYLEIVNEKLPEKVMISAESGSATLFNYGLASAGKVVGRDKYTNGDLASAKQAIDRLVSTWNRFNGAAKIANQIGKTFKIRTQFGTIFEGKLTKVDRGSISLEADWGEKRQIHESNIVSVDDVERKNSGETIKVVDNLRSKSIEELREIAVSLGYNKNKLYGTSKDSIIITIQRLRQEGKKDALSGDSKVRDSFWVWKSKAWGNNYAYAGTNFTSNLNETPHFSSVAEANEYKNRNKIPGGSWGFVLVEVK